MYIGFRHHNDEDNYWMYIDDICYTMVVGIEENEFKTLWEFIQTLQVRVVMLHFLLNRNKM